jgi:MFS transporter, FSR family, fosmidomycin resistance protein
VPPSKTGSYVVSLAALALGHLAVDLFTAIWPVYKTVAQLDLVRAGLIATAASFIGNGMQVVFGVLADRGFTKLLLVGGALLAGSVCLVPYTSNYTLLFVLVALTSLGSAAFHPSGTGAAGALSSTRTGMFVALFLAGGYLGYGSSQLLFTSVYRATGGATAILLPISVLAALALTRFAPPAVSRVLTLATWFRTVRAHASRLSLLFAVQVFAATINITLIFLLPDLLLSRGAPRWMIEGGGHLALVLGSCSALVPAGYASDRLGTRRVLLFVNLFTGILLLLVLWERLSPLAMLPLLAAFGACNSSNSVVCVAEGSRILPGQTSGVSALLMGLPWCFSAFGPVISASLAEPSSGGTPASALHWMALCIPVTLSLCLLLPRHNEKATG